MKTSRLRSIRPGVIGVRISDEKEPYLTSAIIKEQLAAFDEASKVDDVKVIVLEGAGQYFCAGAHKDVLLGNAHAEFIESYHALVRKVLCLPVPTLSLMTGHSVAGGFILGLWCDFPLFAQESLYGINVMDLGFTPCMGATALLPFTLGELLAQEMLFTGKLLTGIELQQRCPLVAHCVHPRAELWKHAEVVLAELDNVSRDALLLFKEFQSAKRLHLFNEVIDKEEVMHEAIFKKGHTKKLIAERYLKGKE